jgi:ABC-type lipoprotein export system ATPase subunit
MRGLDIRFSLHDGEVHAVKGIDMDVMPRETVAIVGESGSGKSQTVMAAVGLLASNGRASGSVRYRGQELLGLSHRSLNQIRGAKITMIFQEPMTSLDPLYKVGDQIAEPIIQHGGLSRQAAREKAIELLDLVQIPHPERRIDAYPHELSGGQRQRVMIAMALANDPDVLIADEPTTDGARRHDPGADSGAPEESPGAARDGDCVHHPRPRHSAPLRGSRLCHAVGRGDGAGAGVPHLQPAGASIHEDAARGGAGRHETPDS